MKTHFVMMANYNEWANARLFRAAGTLKEALYRTVLGVAEPEPLDLLIMQRDKGETV